MVTICTNRLTNSTFCPHTLFMCYVWISEQTVIITLYNNNWSVFSKEKDCVYCAVRTIVLYAYSIRTNCLPQSIKNRFCLFWLFMFSLSTAALRNLQCLTPRSTQTHVYRHSSANRSNDTMIPYRVGQMYSISCVCVCVCVCVEESVVSRKEDGKW